MQRFRVNEPNVVYEVFDEEVVVVNLDTGNYYSLSGTGLRLWFDLADGFSIDEIVARIQARGIGEAEPMVASIGAFAARLVDEQVLVESAAEAARPRAGSDQAWTTLAAFDAPIIENYTDMQDLLMLDPIHDVDETGWPSAKPAP